MINMNNIIKNNSLILKIFLVIILLFIALLNIKEPSPTYGEKASHKASKKVVKIFQFKIEIAAALDKLVKLYEKSHPNTIIEVETAGGGADYGSELKSKFAAGEAPDIFNDDGYADLTTWMDNLEDLSKEPWVKNLVKGTLEGTTKNGKVYGQPMSVEGYGFIYNKTLFQKAGITKLPHTLSELRYVCQALSAAKIMPFENAYQEWWVLGNHNFNLCLAAQKNADKFIAGLNAGTVNLSNNKIANDWLNLLDLTVKYGNKNQLTTDYNTSVTQFALQKAAMTQQGNWIQVQLDSINPKLKLGFLPMPIDDTPNKKIYVGVPNNWVINKNSKNKKEAKDFLNWLVSSKEGKNSIVNDFKFIPAFKNIPYNEKAIGSLGASIKEYTSSDNVLPWNWAKLPDSSTKEIGTNIQSYIGKELTRKQLLENIQRIILNYNRKSSY